MVRCGEWVVIPLAMLGACLFFCGILLRELGQEAWVQLAVGCTGVAVIAVAGCSALVLLCASGNHDLFEPVLKKASIHTFELYRCAFHTLPV